MSAATETPMARMEGTVELSDGRSIGLAEYGVPDGDAIFWFHGTPGGRRQIPPLARRFALDRGIRLIGVERPGVGSSTPYLHDSVAASANDIQQIADRLNIDRFGLVGLSGGGPYVLACAHELPERVVAGAVLGGVKDLKATVQCLDEVGATLAVRATLLLAQGNGAVYSFEVGPQSGAPVAEGRFTVMYK